MNKKLIISSVLTGLLVFPFSILAFTPIPMPGVISLLGALNGIFAILWPIFSAFAVIMFIVAGFLFLTANGESSKITQARNAVIYGTVGVVVGLISFSIPVILSGLF